jgi:hypothetical protein
MAPPNQRALVRQAHVPVCQIAVRCNLEGAQDRDIDVTPANCGKRPGGINNRGARPQCDSPAAGIDQVGIDVLRRGEWTRADHAVLRMDEDIGFRAQIVRHGNRHTHAQVDNHAVADVLGGAPRNLQTVKGPHGQALTCGFPGVSNRRFFSACAIFEPQAVSAPQPFCFQLDA